MIIDLKSWNLWNQHLRSSWVHPLIEFISLWVWVWGEHLACMPMLINLAPPKMLGQQTGGWWIGILEKSKVYFSWNALKCIGANVVLTSCSGISEEEQNHKIQVTSWWQWRNDYTQLRRHFAVQLVNEEATTTTTPTTRTRTRTIRTRTTTTTNLKLVRFCGQVSHLGMYSYINTYIYKDIEYIKYTYIYIYDSLAEPFCLCLCSILEQHATNLSPTADWRSGTTQIYQQLLSLENVMPSTATESDGKKMSSLCDGRPKVWCEKERLIVIEMFKQPVSWWKMGV